MGRYADAFEYYSQIAIGRLVAGLVRPGVISNLKNFQIWQDHGFHITPTHYFSPIPDTRDIEKSYQPRSQAAGIDFRPDAHLQLLEKVFPKYAEEYNALPVEPTEKPGFYLTNGNYEGIDPHVYYSLIRWLQPKKIIEVGSGFTTLLALQAIHKNGGAQFLCIDPYPRDIIPTGAQGVEQVRKKVEDMDSDFFTQLGPNDILFVDDSHVVRMGGDVNFIILDVLPKLAKGVVIHFHDIFLPFNYPKEWVTRMGRYWTEQYLLQAYLTENPRAEVLFGNNYAAFQFPKEVADAFPNALYTEGSGSFWIRKI
ncbi:MAG: class I SAM-dependent methyltransferase [Candidatus Sumerlaeota bacterium]|nr:class I SAM-dependent methyltransferase [Candidatus Sumerlaeota bacterium]